ncbi:AAA family ATPase [Oscillatoria sp. FACHB-1406]|uniref:AAA family ATPase n=1 Tax=Oscillatoria sp. FACHB-1406 TaxID=2692846 RepID=UPI001683EB81|nr:AAA family ATPase [Oscillatoria sp. FACHB-1406]MBD2580537.1 ATP-binding protein [Oscillatoria sp. FACHB-1406]
MNSPNFLAKAIYGGRFPDLPKDLQLHRPFQPLPAGDPTYVNCNEVRGDSDILVELGNELIMSDRNTCQLYAGHRGGGKSTELLRLKADLEQKGFFVVYFAADSEDIEPEDTEYTDILLACTRQILEALKDNADPAPLLNWLKSRWQELKDLALTEVSLESLGIEGQIAQYGKITANLRAEPGQRQKIRERVNPYTVPLIDALNQFIREAKRNLPQGREQLAVIADNLDRIVPVPQEDKHTNHEHIFIDRSEQLKKLDCHIIYTVPISLIYSGRVTDLRDIYGSEAQVLPMVMVHLPDNRPYTAGIEKMKEVLALRVRRIDPNLSLVGDVFAEAESLEMLCAMSGGHVRNLLLIAKQAMGYGTGFPIPKKHLLRSISEARNTYRNAVYANEWELLAKVYASKAIENEEQYRSLLFNRCILEYSETNEEGERHCWYDVHPLIRGIKEFQDACTRV